MTPFGLGGSMTDRTIRNLAHLRRSASTARVLNLLKVYNEHGRSLEWAARPVFKTPALNRALIIKHRLRRDEFDAFHLRRQVATKVVIPIDAEDLKTGGRFVFVEQRNFERLMHEAFGLEPTHQDLNTLRLMDALPSLDPFLLREQLRRGGVEPAPCYFSISDADLERMLAFVEDEIRPLVTLSLGAGIEALRETLNLHPDEYQEGVFCWKGFLYYKWVLTSLLGDVAAVADAVATVKPIGKIDRSSREYIDRGRRVLHERIMTTCEEVSRTLRIYDDAYAGLTVTG